MGDVTQRENKKHGRGHYARLRLLKHTHATLKIALDRYERSTSPSQRVHKGATQKTTPQIRPK